MTDTYIKMVVAAGKPLQDLIPQEEKDWLVQGYCLKHKCHIEIDEMGCPACPAWRDLHYETDLDTDEKDDAFCKEHECGREDWIILPPQKQLWDMLKDTIVEVHKTEEMFYKGFFRHPTNFILETDESKCLEDVLLQGVMYNHFGKKWGASYSDWHCDTFDVVDWDNKDVDYDEIEIGRGNPE